MTSPLSLSPRLSDERSDNRVVVTGLGTVNPLGSDVNSTWAALKAGRSGIRVTDRFGHAPFGKVIAGEVIWFDPERFIKAKRLRHMDRSAQLGLVAALEALHDARLNGTTALGPRCGVIFGSGFGGLTTFEKHYATLDTQGPRKVNPFTLTGLLPDAVSGEIAIEVGASGPNMAVVTASATGATAIGEAAEIIRRGDADVMIAGASEAPLTPILLAGLNAMGALAQPGDDPTRACAPFDALRTGSVLAEGAAAVILESWSHARQRGATPYAELCGYGTANDAFDLVASEPTGRGPVLAMNMALRKASIEPGMVGYYNAHGTGTRMNDRIESLALKRVFGDHAYRLPISSSKSMTGHLMGAAGALEAVVTILALHHSVLPPTINYEHPDADCDLDYIPNKARIAAGLSVAMSHSIGLGGHNASLIFRSAQF
jgi:3-oxoacyl-[acyl-carrier-protein] synthase II